MSNATRNETRRVHLQSVGPVRAMTAAEFSPGDVCAWNFAQLSLVKEIREVSACFLEFTLVSKDRNGAEVTSTRKLKKDRLVAFSLQPWA